MDRVYAFTVKNNSIMSQLISEVDVSCCGRKMSSLRALWDTGATRSCISHRVKEELDLPIDGHEKAFTPSGNKVFTKHIVDIVLPNRVEVQGVSVMDSEIGGQGFDVLIGMDIISNGDFSVSNYEGKTVFTYRIPSQAQTDYVKLINSQKPIKKELKPGRNDLCPCGSGKKYKNCCGR